MLLVFLPVGVVLGLLGWALANSGGRPAGARINNVFGEVAVKIGPAPAFTLPLLTGGTVSLEELRGKVVMVDFWASWCPPCRAEAPALVRVYEQYRGRGVEFVGVAIWDSEGEVAKFVQRYGISYPVVLDKKGTMAVDYGVTGVPEKYFIDQAGQLVRKFVGPVTEGKVSELLEQLLLR